MSRRALALPALALVAVLPLLAGCTPLGAAAPSGSPDPSTSAPGDGAAPERPYPAFDGDCGTVLGEDEVRAATATDAVLQPLAPYAQVWAVAVLGGISCRWGSGGDVVLSTVVIPVDAAGAEVSRRGEGQPQCGAVPGADGDRVGCTFSSTVGGWWLSGVIRLPVGSTVDGIGAVDAMEAAFAARAANARPMIPVPPAGRWSTRGVDCETLGDEVDAASVLDSPGLTAASGNGPSGVAPGVYGALAASGALACIWEQGATDAVPGFSVEIVPGASWALDDLVGLPGAREVEVPGVDRAVAASPLADSPIEYLSTSDGVNLLILEPTYASVDAERLAPLAPVLFAALGG